jgi:hypothetical protein
MARSCSSTAGASSEPSAQAASSEKLSAITRRSAEAGPKRDLSAAIAFTARARRKHLSGRFASSLDLGCSRFALHR